MRRAAAFLACVAACASPPPRTVKPASVASAPPAPLPAPPVDVVDATETHDLFERLVTHVRRFHVFSPTTQKNLGKRWEDDLPRVRREVEAARTRDELSTALARFANSLHDVHCQFRAAKPLPRKKLGFTVGVEKGNGAFQFYVEAIQDEALKDRFSPGDIVVEVDGIPASRFLEEHDLVSNQNCKENVALDIASWLTVRRSAKEGATSSWTVRPRAGGAERSVDVTWTKKLPSGGPQFAIDYTTKECLDQAPKSYGPGYTLAARGYRLCIYTSTAPIYRDYPVVQHVSFQYDEVPHGPLADFELVKGTLANAKAKGVVLDVQDNHGGVNPNFFVEWWTDKPYVDTYTFTVLDRELLEGPGGEPNVSSHTPALAAWYADELAKKKDGQRFSTARPFACRPETCRWDNRYEPKHRVTKVPVALVLGPDCASTCDAVAFHFAKRKIGPIVGRPAMGGFTTHRAKFDVALRHGEPPLGTIDLAISFDTEGSSDPADSIEGTQVPIDVSVPRTFENHARYDALLVEKAVQALRR